MYSRIIIAGIGQAFTDCSEFVWKSGFTLFEPPYSLRRVLDQAAVWFPTGVRGVDYFLKEWSFAPMLADEVYVHEDALRSDTEHQHNQHWYHYSHLWSLLSAEHLVAPFSPSTLSASEREDIFRWTTDLTLFCLRSRIDEEKLPLDTSSFGTDLLLWIENTREIIYWILLSECLHASILWPTTLLPWVVDTLSRIVPLSEKESPTNLLRQSPLLYEATLPHVPLLESERCIVRTYPENIEVLAQLRRNSTIGLAKALFQNTHNLTEKDIMEWAKEFNEVSSTLLSIEKSSIWLTRLTAFFGVGFGVAGLAYLPAGIAGLGISLFGPLADMFLGDKAKKIGKHHPIATELFRTKQMLKEEYIYLKKKVGDRNVWKVREYDPDRFLRSLERKQFTVEQVQKCLGIKRNGTLCGRRVRNSLFCWQHRPSAQSADCD